MSEPGKAVFLSYASQDAEVAKRICEALRATGVEVWFDQSELRGGDAWDGLIRKRIKECALFVPVITPNTNARAEGYFRLEWKLAVDRSHLMADDAPFLFPIVVGDLNDATARVPDKFRDVQWTRLRLDETPAELGARVAKLLSGGSSVGGVLHPDGSSKSGHKAPPTTKPARWQWWMIFPVLGMIMGLMFAAIPLWKMIQGPPPKRPPQLQTPDPKPQTQPLSAARQLAERARALSLDQYNSTPSDYATAEGLIQKAVELDPNDAEIWAIASLFHTSIRTRGFDQAPGRREQARAAAERATKLAPDSVNALFALGRTQRDSDHTAAEISFKRILALDPNHADAMSQLGWICDLTDRFDEALVFYDRVLELDPQDAPLTHYLRYLLFFHYGRFAEAEAEIRRSVALQPSANSITGLAMVALTWRGDAETAARALAAAPAELQSQTRMIWVGAIVHLARRDPAEVLRTLARTESDYIQDNWFAGPKALFAGLAHRQAGRHEAARVAWESALAVVEARLKTTPESRALHLSRGQLLAWLGRTDEARREARTLEEMSRAPAVVDWIFAPMLVHAALGDAAAVVPPLEQALAWDGKKNAGWPLTPALLRVDARWDALRGDPRFRKLAEEPTPAPAAVSPARELADKALALVHGLEVSREDLALAEDYCQRAMKLDSADGEIWAVYAFVHGAYVYRGWDPTPARREQNRVAGERAIRLAPKSVNARMAQAGAWSTFGVNRAETEKLLREVVAEQPDNQFALRFLAVTVLGRGELEECLALNERSAALPGGDPLALYNNARYLQLRGRQEEAYATMQRAIAQQPFTSALVFKTLMEIYARGDLLAAAATLERIPPAALLEDRANYIAGLLRYYQRNAEAALKAWGAFPRDAYEDFQFDGPKGLLIGLAYELDGREAAAKIEWRAALQVADKRLAATSNNPRRHYDRAYLLACLGEKEAVEALRTYEQLAGVKLGPGVPMTFELALIYAQLGRLDDLFAHWPEKAIGRIRLDPRFDKVRADPRFAAPLKEPAAKK